MHLLCNWLCLGSYMRDMAAVLHCTLQLLLRAQHLARKAHSLLIPMLHLLVRRCSSMLSWWAQDVFTVAAREALTTRLQGSLTTANAAAAADLDRELELQVCELRFSASRC